MGKIQFKKGKYIYVGSAQNNIEKRVARHYSKNKKKHWHIDYLLADPNVEIEKAICKEAGKEDECKTASLLLKSEKPINRFGCSDCNCNSHLFRLNPLNHKFRNYNI